MKCTKCQSDNTQRLQVIYEGGTQSINTQSVSAGAGFGGVLGIGGGVTNTSGTAQSGLAQKSAPPAKKPLKAFVIAIFFGVFLFSNSADVGAGAALFGLLLIGGAGYLGFQARQFNSTVWPGLYQHWQNCWMCQKCGTIYHQA